MRINTVPVLIEGNSAFPERLPVDKISVLKKQLGSYIFSAQMLLNPIAKEDQVFKIEWIKYWDRIPDNLIIYIAVDPASTVKKKSDYSAFTVHGFDEKQNWYRLDMYRDKLSADQRISQLFRLYKKWQPYSQKPIKVLYETVGFQITDKQNIEREQSKHGLKIKIIEMGSGEMKKTAKVDRISAQQPYFERGEVLIPKQSIHYSFYESKNIDMVQEFLNEYSFFPKSTNHDDLLDTGSFPMYCEDWKNLRASTEEKKPEIPNDCLHSILERTSRFNFFKKLPSNMYNNRLFSMHIKR